MLIEYDTEHQTAYYLLEEGEIACTVEISDVVMVDVDAQGHPLGVEVATELEKVERETWQRLFDRSPSLKEHLPAYTTGALLPPSVR